MYDSRTSGTGKTKTIIGMLEMLLLSGHAKSDLRIVVCAPSNKAVYVLLRAYNAKVMSLKSSSVKPLLVGVEDNLPSDLRPYVIFVDSLISSDSLHQITTTVTLFTTQKYTSTLTSRTSRHHFKMLPTTTTPNVISRTSREL